MPPSPELETKFQACDPEIQQFIIQLQSENAKAQTRIAKLEAQKVSNENRITALEKELDRYVEPFSHKNTDLPTIASVKDYIDSLPK